MELHPYQDTVYEQMTESSVFTGFEPIALSFLFCILKTLVASS